MNDPFSYQQLPSGIHVLHLHTGHRESYEQCFACLDKIFAEASPKAPLLLLSIVNQFDVQRIPDLWRLSRKLLVKFPQKRLLYNAVVYSSPGTFSPLLTAMSQLASIFGARIYICRVGEQPKAEAWLLDQMVGK
jgi:hypothetical protein